MDNDRLGGSVIDGEDVHNGQADEQLHMRVALVSTGAPGRSTGVGTADSWSPVPRPRGPHATQTRPDSLTRSQYREHVDRTSSRTSGLHANRETDESIGGVERNSSHPYDLINRAPVAKSDIGRIGIVIDCNSWRQVSLFCRPEGRVPFGQTKDLNSEHVAGLVEIDNRFDKLNFKRRAESDQGVRSDPADSLTHRCPALGGPR